MSIEIMINAYFALKERKSMNAWELTKTMEKLKMEILQLIDKKRSAHTITERNLIDEEIDRKENVIFGIVEILKGVKVE